MLIFEQKP